MQFKRHQLPVGDDVVPVLVASESGEPKAVFMSYEAFLELAATLYTAIEALRVSGIDPGEVFADEDADMLREAVDPSDAEAYLSAVPDPDDNPAGESGEAVLKQIFSSDDESFTIRDTSDDEPTPDPR